MSVFQAVLLCLFLIWLYDEVEHISYKPSAILISNLFIKAVTVIMAYSLISSVLTKPMVY